MSEQLRQIEQELAALIAVDRLEEAEAALRRLLASGTGPLVLWSRLAFVLRQLGRPAEALPILRMLVDNTPGDLALRFDMSETLLLLGEFDAGWRAYRFRYSMPHTTRIERKVQAPRWEGERLTGKTMLVHDEQGYGDTFQFMRLLHLAKERSNARVIFDVNAESFSLAARAVADGLLSGPDAVIRSTDLPPPFDVHCELMSLPMALGLTLADLPGPLPYLSPDPTRLETWRKRLADLPRPLVALTWAGRPTHTNDANRSMSLDMFAPLAVPGVHFLAIQKGPAAAQALTPPPGMAITSLDAEIQDFEDTAAILMLADMLVSVDSSPVHLAGALGRPAWVMLPFVPDWRWLIGRGDTPWYPQHRLFRQSRRRHWDDVLANLATALTELRDRVQTTG